MMIVVMSLEGEPPRRTHAGWFAAHVDSVNSMLSAAGSTGNFLARAQPIVAREGERASRTIPHVKSAAAQRSPTRSRRANSMRMKAEEGKGRALRGAMRLREASSFAAARGNESCAFCARCRISDERQVDFDVGERRFEGRMRASSRDL